MPLLDDVATYLASNGAGTVGSTIWVGQMPDDCNAGLVLIEYGGEAPDYELLTAGVYIEKPRFQVYGRHTVYATGRALMETAYQALASVVNQTLTATKYLRIEPLQQPFQLVPPQDALSRWEWRFNARAEKALG